MLEIGYISAFIGGLLTFLAPCTLPLIPAYMSFLAGSQKSADGKVWWNHIMRNSLLFTIGFSIVFMFFGMISGAVGQFFVLHRAALSQFGGIIVIVFGLSMLGVIDIPQLFTGKKIPTFIHPGKPFSSLLLGLVFALGWSPCLGPILGTILVLAGTSGTAFQGALLLFVYSLGLAIPFLTIAAVYGVSFAYINSLARVLPYVNKVGGALFVVMGALLIFGEFGLLSVWVEKFIGSNWYTGLMEKM